MKFLSTVLDIQRMSTEDGPGLRTTVFLKGCNLHCTWCHNPESIDARPVVQWNRVRCIGCHSCYDLCQNNALIHSTDGISINAELCTLCLSCVKECPSGALNVKGEYFEGDQLLRELLKDKAYFGDSGGITISGGEPLLQFEAVLWLLRELKREGIQTALDTAGLVRLQHLIKALELTNLLLYDIKFIDNNAHKEHTGRGNKKILQNLVEAAHFLLEKKKKLWIRSPIIPGATDNDENISSIGSFIEKNLDGAVERWELCAFNNLCLHKYQSLGWDWTYKDADLIAKPVMEKLTMLAKEKLANTSTEVFWTGSKLVE